MVLLGTITQIVRGDRHTARIHVRVDHSYRGGSQKSLVLTDDGICSGPEPIEGEQYLIYTRHLGDDIPWRGYTRSNRARYAVEDLQYLNSLAPAPPTGSISGAVIFVPDTRARRNEPIGGASIEAAGPDATYMTSADEAGRYWFGRMQPREYVISAEHAGMRTLMDFYGRPQSVNVTAHACTVANVFMKKDWPGSIVGRVTQSSGEPLQGADVTLLKVTVKGDRPNYDDAVVATIADDKGDFGFRALAPGEYQIALNYERFPTEESPYGRTFWPSGRAGTEGGTITIMEAAAPLQVDFKLEPPSKPVRLTGRTITADGEPVHDVDVMIFTVTGDDTDIAYSRLHTDGDGAFVLTAFDGFRYRFAAFSADGTLTSEGLDVRITTMTHEVTLVMKEREDPVDAPPPPE